MPQINKGDTFADGEQVTALRLNQFIDSATILPAVITDQVALTANTVASNDAILLYDLSATALREANISDVLGSNLPVTTSAVTGGAATNVTITPAATYAVAIVGNATISGNTTTTGNSSVGGTLVVTSSTTLTGNVIADNGFTSNGIANFAGTLQYKATPIFGLYNISSVLISTLAGFVETFNNIRISLVTNWAVAGGDVTGAGGGVHWKESHIIPTGETWEITWHWYFMKGGDDTLGVGIIRNLNGGSWTQIFDSYQAPVTYSNTPMCNVEVLTNTTGSPVTYNYAFKSAWGGGSGTDQAIACNGGCATRVIRKYKTA